ncbi:hypothetical protein DXG01_017012 [Tephrocybe rancida]|nr:hypothetical protein DXG01_017012 [Tephrocybe rancida]
MLKTFITSSDSPRQRFKRPLRDSDWERFDHYAVMIHDIKLGHTVKSRKLRKLVPTDIHENVFTALVNFAEKSGRKSLLPNLRRVTLSLDTSNAFIAKSIPTLDGYSRSLLDVHLGAGSWTTAAEILGCIRSRVEKLDIQIDTCYDDYDYDNQYPTSRSFQDVAAAIAANPLLNQSLKKLTMGDSREDEIYEELPRDTFQPFLSLNALQHLVLQISDLEHLNDEWLSAAATAWPDIQTLIISAVETRFSLKGLIPLLQNCRKITTLELHPTAVPFDLSLLPADGSASNNKISGVFSLHKARVDQLVPGAVFACVNAMFPRVTGIERADITFGKDFDSSDEDEDEYREKWEILERLFKDHNAP